MIASSRLPAQELMLDRDLADVYGVSAKRLNEQVKCNRDRIPPDFAFQLTRAESEPCPRYRAWARAFDR